MNILEKVALIETCYSRLEMLQERLDQPLGAIERIVDLNTGYNPTREIIKEAVELLDTIIANKSELGLDSENDEEVRERIIKIGRRVFAK